MLQRGSADSVCLAVVETLLKSVYQELDTAQLEHYKKIVTFILSKHIIGATITQVELLANHPYRHLISILQTIRRPKPNPSISFIKTHAERSLLHL